MFDKYLSRKLLKNSSICYKLFMNDIV